MKPKIILSKQQRFLFLALFSFIFVFLLCSPLLTASGLGTLIIKEKPEWKVTHTTDMDYFVWVGDKNKQKTEICLLSKSATKMNDIAQDKNTYQKGGVSLEKLTRKQKKASDTKLDKDYYGYCRLINTETYVKFGEASTIVEYEGESKIEYAEGNVKTNFTLKKWNGTDYSINPETIWVKNQSECFSLNKFGLCFGAIDNSMNETDLANFVYEINSTADLFLIENYHSIDDNLSWEYPIFYTLEKINSWQEERQKYNFHDICQKPYSNCRWEIAENSAKVYFTSDKNIDPDVYNVTSCLTINTSNSFYQLNQSLTASGTCFVVFADNVTIDGNGKSITYGQNGVDNGYGVYAGSNQKNVTIKNVNFIEGNLTGQNKFGVYLLSANSSQIQNNNFTTIGNFSHGIYLANASGNILNVNSFRVTGPNAGGITLRQSSNNILSDNNIIDSLYFGVYLVTSLNNTLINNNANCSVNSGYRIEALSERNILINNTGRSNQNTGIQLINASNNILINNTGITNLNNGIALLTFSNNNTFIGNDAFGKTGTAFLISNSHNNTLILNNGKGNLSYGLRLSGSNYNFIAGMTANSNFSYGMSFTNANHNIIQDCVNISGTGDILYVTTISVNNSFINCSYRTEGNNESIMAGGILFRKWWYKATAKDLGNIPVTAIINAYNVSGGLEFSTGSNLNGSSPITPITSYVNFGGTKTYYSLYNLTATNSTAIPVILSHQFNASLQNNLSDLFLFTLFYNDTLYPNGILISPPNNTQTNNSQQNLTINATDDFNLANLTLYVYNETGGLINKTTINATGTGGVFGIIYNFFTEGIFTWFYEVADWFGNTFTTLVNYIVIDTSSPLAIYLSPTPANNSYVIDGNIRINISATDTNLSSINVFIFNDSNILIANFTKISLPISPAYFSQPNLSDGNYYFNATACDIFYNCANLETRKVMLQDITLLPLTYNVLISQYPYIDFNSSTLFQLIYQFGNIPVSDANTTIYITQPNSSIISFPMVYNATAGSYFIYLAFNQVGTYYFEINSTHLIYGNQSIAGNFIVAVPYYVDIEVFEGKTIVDADRYINDFSYITAEFTEGRKYDDTLENFIVPLSYQKIYDTPVFHGKYTNGRARIKLYELNRTYAFRLVDGQIAFPNGEYSAPNLTKSYGTNFFLGRNYQNGTNQTLLIYSAPSEIHQYRALFNWLLVGGLIFALIMAIFLLFIIPDKPMISIALSVGFSILLIVIRIAVWLIWSW